MRILLTYRKAMFAVVEVQGKQYEVELGEYVHVDHMGTAENETVVLDKVLIFGNDKETKVGTPYVEGVTVEAISLGLDKGPKIRVFKKKPKKRYERTIGSRAHYTLLQITAIAGEKAPAKAATKKAAVKKTEEKATEAKAAPKKATTSKKAPAAKKTTTKKTTTAKKAPAKKTAAKKEAK